MQEIFGNNHAKHYALLDSNLEKPEGTWPVNAPDWQNIKSFMKQKDPVNLLELLYLPDLTAFVTQDFNPQHSERTTFLRTTTTEKT